MPAFFLARRGKTFRDGGAGEVEGKEAEKRVKKKRWKRERERYDKNEKEKGDARIYLDGRNGATLELVDR